MKTKILLFLVVLLMVGCINDGKNQEKIKPNTVRTRITSTTTTTTTTSTTTTTIINSIIKKPLTDLIKKDNPEITDMEEILSQCTEREDLRKNDYCIYELSVENDYPKGCERIKPSDWDKIREKTDMSKSPSGFYPYLPLENIGHKECCYTKIAVYRLDPELCYKIDNVEKIDINRMSAIYPYFRDKCLERVGVLTKNISICEKILDKFYKGRCYQHIAIMTNDSTLCEKISYGNKRVESEIDKCKSFVYGYNNKELCETLKEDYLYELCRFETSWHKNNLDSNIEEYSNPDPKINNCVAISLFYQ